MSDPTNPEWRFEWVPRGLSSSPFGNFGGRYVRAPDLDTAFQSLPERTGGHWRLDERWVPWKPGITF
mgnify:FL=1